MSRTEVSIARAWCGAVVLSAAAAAFADTPSVSDVTVAQDASTRTVTVGYTLAGAPAIVTLDVLTNGVSIGQEHVWSLAGDVNAVVQPGSGKTLAWHPDKSWPNQTFGAGVVSVKVTAWATDDPPAYLAVNLAAEGDVKYYTCAEAVPGGVTNRLYKTSALLLRRVYAKDVPWMMGSPLDEPGRYPNNWDKRERQHEVTLTNDYYIGVYPVTQRQWHYVTGGDRPSFYANNTCWEGRPVENIAFAQLRLNAYDKTAVQAAYHWPAAPFAGSFLDLLRTRSGGLAFDLPYAA